MSDQSMKRLASGCLVVGAILGMAGSFAPSDALRGLAWGIDGTALVVAAALLTIHYFRLGQELVASGFLVFAIGESLVLSGAAMKLIDSGPSFAAGAFLWAAGLVLVSAAPVFTLVVRVLGYAAAALFTITALRILAGAAITPLSSPLPFYAYPVLVAVMLGWVFTLLRDNRGSA